MRKKVDFFMAHLSVERGLSANTLGAYGSDLAHYVDFLRQKRKYNDFSQVKAQDIKDFLMNEKSRKLSAMSIARALVAIRVLHRFLLHEGQVQEDVSLLVDAPQSFQVFTRLFIAKTY